MSAFIEIEHVDYVYESYNARIHALKDITLSIGEGEYWAILGRNGSGKSTLARLLNGLLTPTSGRITVAGWSTADPHRLRDIRQRVGLVFQSPDDQLVANTIEEDVAFGLENLGVPRGEMAERIRQALVSVDMWHHRLRPPSRLSAGQKQRVAIAGILAMRPKCLVLDEATAMLDPAGRREVLRLIRQLHRTGVAIVAITHHMEEALEAERIAVLHEGELVLSGTPRQVFGEADALERFGLELPPVPALAHELHRRDNRFPPTCLTVAEVLDALRALQLASWPNRAAADDGCARDAGPGLVSTRNGPFFAVRHLSHVYGRGTPFETPSLHDISLEIGRGDSVGLIGPTGSGKSTLLQHLCGLIRPQAGQVWVEGADLSDGRTDLREVRQRVGMVFQLPEDQLFERYVGDDVAFAPRNQGLTRAEVRERVREAMEAVGLPFEAFKDRLTFTLSGGERRKAALAGVLAMRPTALLLDEPTAGLDPHGRRELLARLRQWQTDRGLTVVVSSHNMDDLVALVRHVEVLRAGGQMLRGAIRDVFAQTALLRQYGLGLPPAAAINAGLRAAGVPLPPNMLSLGELADALIQLLPVKELG